MKNTRKTIKVSEIVAKANFDLLVSCFVHNNKTLGETKYDFAKYLLIQTEAYNGFNMYFETNQVYQFITKYNNEHSNLYSESELKMITDAHTASINRIADMWYNETGNILPDVIDEGIIKDHELHSKWIQFSAKYFQEDNWVKLY